MPQKANDDEMRTICEHKCHILTSHMQCAQELLDAVEAGPWDTLARRRVKHFGFEFRWGAAEVCHTTDSVPYCLNTISRAMYRWPCGPTANEFTLFFRSIPFQVPDPGCGPAAADCGDAARGGGAAAAAAGRRRQRPAGSADSQRVQRRRWAVAAHRHPLGIHRYPSHQQSMSHASQTSQQRSSFCRRCHSCSAAPMRTACQLWCQCKLPKAIMVPMQIANVACCDRTYCEIQAPFCRCRWRGRR